MRSSRTPAKRWSKTWSPPASAALTAPRPFEIDLIRRLAPDAAIHYNNPVRVAAEIAHAVARGVKSYSRSIRHPNWPS